MLYWDCPCAGCAGDRMSTESKRRWRLRNPERSRTAEANRAALRRKHGRVIEGAGGKLTFFSYPSGESYQRYENGGGNCSPREQALRSLAGIGRSESRYRQAMRRLRERITTKTALFDALATVAQTMGAREPGGRADG